MKISSFPRIPAIVLAALAVTGRFSHAQTQPKADLIVVNGNVYTVDDARPRASAFAVRAGKSCSSARTVRRVFSLDLQPE
jgi:hypothetical protein